jgi:hypothetical protein
MTGRGQALGCKGADGGAAQMPLIFGGQLS